MVVKRFSELPDKARTELPSGYKLVGVTGTGTQGRNVNFNPWELRCPGLPAGYSSCSYIENIGDTYIDTGVPSSEKVGIQMTYMFLDHPHSGQGAIIIGAGAASGTFVDTRQWINDTSGGNLAVGWGINEPHGITSKPNTLAYGQVNFCMSHQATVNLSGAADLDLDDPENGFTGWNLYLFSCNGSASGTPVSPTHSKLYRCRLSVGWDVVRDFFPVVHKITINGQERDEFCLFDAIEKKIYLPKVGSLTGERLNDIWDYSHFVGNEGAYIDDYPTPDSPNFVRTSGVEAGMEQIREALILNNVLKERMLRVSYIVPAFRDIQKKAVIDNSVWYNFPYIDFSKFSTSTAPDVAPSEDSALPEFSMKLEGGTDPYRNLVLANTSSKYKSYYFNIGRYYGFSVNQSATRYFLYLAQNNCDYVIKTNNVSSNRIMSAGSAGVYVPAGTFASKNNSTLRILASTAVDQGATPYSRLGLAAMPVCPTYVYTPLWDTYLYNSCQYASSSFYYLPSLTNKGPNYLGLTKFVDPTDTAANWGYNKAMNLIDIIKTFKFLCRQPVDSSGIWTISIAASYFLKEITTEASTTSPSTTHTTTYNKSDRSIIVTKVVTDGVTKTTIIYTLDNSVESNMLRDILWNTNGVIDPTSGIKTSTGLLDGVRQVGPNIGKPYTYYWKLNIIPIE